MTRDAEHILLNLAAIAIVAALLLALANTPLYPLALGIEVVALLYTLLTPRGAGVLGTLTGFVAGQLGPSAAAPASSAGAGRNNRAPVAQ